MLKAPGFKRRSLDPTSHRRFTMAPLGGRKRSGSLVSALKAAVQVDDDDEEATTKTTTTKSVNENEKNKLPKAVRDVRAKIGNNIDPKSINSNPIA